MYISQDLNPLECRLWQSYHTFPCDISLFNTLRPRPNRRHFADDIFKCIFLNENVWIPIKISLKLVTQGPIINIPALVQIMAWRRPGDKPLSEPVMISLLTHICVTRPQWVKMFSTTIIASWGQDTNWQHRGVKRPHLPQTVVFIFAPRVYFLFWTHTQVLAVPSEMKSTWDEGNKYYLL